MTSAIGHVIEAVILAIGVSRLVAKATTHTIDVGNPIIRKIVSTTSVRSSITEAIDESAPVTKDTTSAAITDSPVADSGGLFRSSDSNG